jgi:hypothetical protein
VTAAARALIARLRQAGAMLTCREDGKVGFSAPVPLPAALLAEARKHREAIAAALTADAAEPPGTRDNANAWGFTPAERTAALARLRPQRSEASDAALAAGYRRAALRRPPSWWRAEAHKPTPGATCSTCAGMRWWSRDECGWCCATCHPPSDATKVVREVRT